MVMRSCFCVGGDLLDLRYQSPHQTAAGEQQVVRRRLVDVVAGGGEPPLQPVQQVLSLLLDELHLLHVLVQGGAQLLHLPVPLVGQLFVQEDQRAVGWKVGQQIDQRRPLSLVQLEDVHVRDGDEGVLRHHGHGLCRLRQLLYRQALTGETVVVELLEARRDQQFLQPLRHGLEQMALLTVENIEISRYACLHGGPQRLIAAAAALLFAMSVLSLRRDAHRALPVRAPDVRTLCPPAAP